MADTSAIQLQRVSIWLEADQPNQVETDSEEGWRRDREALIALANSTLAEQTLDYSGELRPDQVHQSKYGPYMVQYRQVVDGTDVFGAQLNIVLDRQLRPRLIDGGLATANAQTAGQKHWQLPAKQAVRLALQQSGYADAKSQVLHELAEQGPFRRFSSDSDGQPQTKSPVRLRQYWFPAANGLQAIYAVESISPSATTAHPDAQRRLICGNSGRLLGQRSLIQHHQPFDYRVFADEDGHPYVDPFGFTNPHPTGVADGYLPEQQAPMPLLSLSHSGISTEDPWLPADATATKGNRVDAFFRALPVEQGVYVWDMGVVGWQYFDADRGDFRAPLNGPYRFDYAYSVDAAPFDYFQPAGSPVVGPPPQDSTQLLAKIVQGFYAANWLHDLFYDLGFDEQAGNAQEDNFGRGGLGGDPMIVHSAAPATFAMTPADGESPVLALGWNAFSGSNRDVSGFSMDVIAHEWAHVLFGRLTESSGIGRQWGAINEGTADFVAVLLSLREQDRHHATGKPAFYGTYAAGAYFNLDYHNPFSSGPPAGQGDVPDNTYYHGVRRFPYSADRERNPLTFRHISMDHPLDAGWQAFDWKSRSLTNAEVHSAGEVWTSALWQCTRNVLADTTPDSFAATRDRILAYLVAGLKLMPVDPSYTEARNALLMAIRVDDESAYDLCRDGFRQRGMGAGALAPPHNSVDFRGVVESFDSAEQALSLTDAGLANPGGLLFAGIGKLYLDVLNSGLLPLQDLSWQIDTQQGLVQLPSLDDFPLPTLAAGESTRLELPLHVLSAEAQTVLRLQISVSDQTAGVSDQRSVELTANRLLQRSQSQHQAGDAVLFARDWRTEAGDMPHGCTMGCLGDLENWRLQQHLGEAAIKVSSEHVGLDARLIGPEFRVAGGEPLRLHLRHAYAITRDNPLPVVHGTPYGRLELRLDSGEWEPADSYLDNGSAQFSGESNGWQDTVLDFGTALAGRDLSVRLRLHSNPTFAPQEVYWALSSIAVEGAEEPVFLDWEQSPPRIDARFSGFYFDPQRDGEGWVLEVLDEDTAILAWFTYPAEPDDLVDQRWVFGVGDIDGMQIRIEESFHTRGAGFGDAFDMDLIEHLPWDSLQLTFEDCGKLSIDYQGPEGYGSGSRQAVRLTEIAGLGCDDAEAIPVDAVENALSGAWYNPERDGEGWFLHQIGGDQAVVVWFSYNPEGDQAWMLGTGEWQSDQLWFEHMQRPHGTAFGDGFDTAELQKPTWGSLRVTPQGCNDAEIEFESQATGYGDLSSEVVRLSHPMGIQCNE